MITSLGIEKFWEHINEIERTIDAGTSFPPYNIVRHDEENATIEFAVAGYKKDDIEITVHPHLKTIRFWKLLLIVNLQREKTKSLSIEESLAANSALDYLSPKIGMSPEPTARTESSL